MSEGLKRLLLLVDGHAYAYRAFYAIRSLASPDGRPTNAIYGFIKMLAKMEAALQPTHLAVIWDGGLSPERMAALPEYKAHRPPLPGDLAVQLDEIAAYLRAAGTRSLQEDGVEADDWIAAAARHASAAGFRVVIASSDKDFMQLVSTSVGLLNPNDKSGKIWTADDVRARTGVAPDQIVDWLALTGDTVDNISGVPGVGPKTAAALLQEFGSAAAMYSRLEEVASARVREAVSAAASVVRRNQALVRLPDDIGADCEAGEWRRGPQNPDGLRDLYRRWGFNSLMKELEAKQPDRFQGKLL